MQNKSVIFYGGFIMKKRLLSLAIVLTMVCSVVPIVNICISAESEPQATSGNNVESILDRIKSDFDLVWHDEFDGDTLDETKWQYDGDAVFRNSEAQMYSNGPEDGNVYMENGNVVLKAKKRMFIITTALAENIQAVKFQRRARRILNTDFLSLTQKFLTVTILFLLFG